MKLDTKSMIYRNKMITYPKCELEADKQLIKEMAEMINTLKEVIQDKENDGKKQDANS